MLQGIFLFTYIYTQVPKIIKIMLTTECLKRTGLAAVPKVRGHNRNALLQQRNMAISTVLESVYSGTACFLSVGLAGQMNFYFLCYSAPIWLIRGGLAFHRGENREHGRTIKTIKMEKSIPAFMCNKHIHLFTLKKPTHINIYFLVTEHSYCWTDRSMPVLIQRSGRWGTFPQKGKINKWTQGGSCKHSRREAQMAPHQFLVIDQFP